MMIVPTFARARRVERVCVGGLSFSFVRRPEQTAATAAHFDHSRNGTSSLAMAFTATDAPVGSHAPWSRSSLEDGARGTPALLEHRTGRIG